MDWHNFEWPQRPTYICQCSYECWNMEIWGSWSSYKVVCWWNMSSFLVLNFLIVDDNARLLCAALVTSGWRNLMNGLARISSGFKVLNSMKHALDTPIHCFVSLQPPSSSREGLQTLFIINTHSYWKNVWTI